MSAARILPLLLVALLAGPSFAGGLVRNIAAIDYGPEFDKLAAQFRAEGPQGLATVLQAYEGQRLSHSDAQKYRQFITRIAAQRDAHVSRLYWYTDLDEAKRAADAAGKPILSLRMLGKLTDEYSCANSRFFRTALYANKQISDYLRENYILHWQSVRPVPRVTIDFGDGRKLQRTITGNSAHYVLDGAGRPLEALPGLYGPKAFQEWLVRSKELADRLMLVSNRNVITTLLKEHHAVRSNVIAEALRLDLEAHAPGLLKPDPQAALSDEAPANAPQPNAQVASIRALTKSAAEAPLLAFLLPSDDLLRAQDNSLWEKIAAARADDARLDSASAGLMRSEHPTAELAGIRSDSKVRQEDPVLRMIRTFEQSMAIDTVKNEYLLHRKIHEWFVDGDAPADVDALNEKVYAELFLTPSSDPWLGLAPADAYTALDNGGMTSMPNDSDR